MKKTFFGILSGVLLSVSTAVIAETTAQKITVPLSPPVIVSKGVYSREIISAPAGKHCGERAVPNNSEINVGRFGCTFNYKPTPPNYKATPPSQYFATIVLKSSGAAGSNVIGLQFKWMLWQWTLDSAGNATGVAPLMNLGTTTKPTVDILQLGGGNNNTAAVPCFLSVENAAINRQIVWSGQCIKPIPN